LLTEGGHRLARRLIDGVSKEEKFQSNRKSTKRGKIPKSNKEKHQKRKIAKSNKEKYQIRKFQSPNKKFQSPIKTQLNNNMPHPEVVLPTLCLLGEGTLWHAAQNCIYWIDIIPGDIHRYSVDKKTHDIFNIGQMIGAIAIRKNGGFVAAMQHGFYFVDFDNKTIQPITDPEKSLPGNRFNDGKCDPAGRFWAGTMPLNEKDAVGNLYMLDTDLSVTLKVPNVTISNGLAWSRDYSTLYYIDTPTRYVVAYDFDVANGNIGNKRIVIDVHHEKGYPDGMTIDEAGMLWIAFYGGWRVAQYNPNTGKLLQEIQFPVANITCCTFGGPLLQDLYVSTAKKELSPDELLAQPLAGSLFVINDVGSKGIPAFEFAG